jgi:hypothetical protein
MAFFTNALDYPLIPSNNLILGNGTGSPGVATITGAGGTTVTFPGGNILITSSTVDTPLIIVTTTTQAMATNTRYVANNAALVTFTLPTTSAVGDLVAVSGDLAGGGGWTIAQNALQYMQVGQGVTTTGTGGSLSSTQSGDAITLYCFIANTAWKIFNAPQGSLNGV